MRDARERGGLLARASVVMAVAETVALLLLRRMGPPPGGRVGWTSTMVGMMGRDGDARLDLFL
jgi:hypothetical protein